MKQGQKRASFFLFCSAPEQTEWRQRTLAKAIYSAEPSRSSLITPSTQPDRWVFPDPISVTHEIRHHRHPDTPDSPPLFLSSGFSDLIPYTVWCFLSELSSLPTTQIQLLPHLLELALVSIDKVRARPSQTAKTSNNRGHDSFSTLSDIIAKIPTVQSATCPRWRA